MDDRRTVAPTRQWEAGQIDWTTRYGSGKVRGWVSPPFGIDERAAGIFTVTHLPTRCGIFSGLGFSTLALAQQFVEKILPLLDWTSAIKASPELGDKIRAIAEAVEHGSLWRL